MTFQAPVLASDPCPVVELRRCALRPGQREALIDLFDRESFRRLNGARFCPERSIPGSIPTARSTQSKPV